MDEEILKPNPLEYRPSFERPEREKTGWDITQEQEEKPILAVEGEYEIGEGILTHTIEDFYEVISILDEFIEELESKLKHVPIKFDESWTEDVIRAKKELGLSEDSVLTYLDYKKALQKSDTSAGDFLLNIIENHAEDVEGNLEMELYGEAIEMREEMKITELYMEQMLYPIIGYKKAGEEWVEQLAKAEEVWGVKKKDQLSNKKQIDAAYLNALLFEPQLVPNTRGRLHQVEREYDAIRHEMNHLESTLSVVGTRADDTVELTNSMRVLLEKKVKKEEVLTELFSLAENKLEEDEGLSNMKLMLKLTVDVHNKEKNHYKNNLRNTFSTSKQKLMLSELAVQEEMFRKKTLPLLHHMRGYQSEVSKETTELFNQIAFGIEENEKNRKDKMYEAFLTNQATSILRRTKIANVDKKETARKGYKIAHDEIERRKSE